MKQISKELFLKAIKVGRRDLVAKTKNKRYGIDKIEYEIRRSIK